MRDVYERYIHNTPERQGISGRITLNYLLQAIEVDGVSFHENELQKECDNKKDRIMNAVGLPLLRLYTDGHN